MCTAFQVMKMLVTSSLKTNSTSNVEVAINSVSDLVNPMRIRDSVMFHMNRLSVQVLPFVVHQRSKTNSLFDMVHDAKSRWTSSFYHVSSRL